VRVASDEAAQIAVRLGGEEAVPADFDGELWSRASDGSWEIEVTDPIRGCPLLGGNGCTVQDIKPRQCATYPFWPEVVRNERTWRNEARACEGIGSGRHYGADAIHALLAGVESTTVEEPSNE
jgi:Fe-S-cluster containining protein